MAEVETRSLGIAWRILLVADAAVLAYGLMAVFRPEVLIPGFEASTGRNWDALHSESPETAAYLLLVGRVIGGLNIAFASVALAVVWVPFRRGDPWSWYVLLIGNSLGYGTPIAHDVTVGAIGPFEQIEIVLIALVYVALGMSAREFLGRGRPG